MAAMAASLSVYIATARFRRVARDWYIAKTTVLNSMLGVVDVCGGILMPQFQADGTSVIPRCFAAG